VIIKGNTDKKNVNFNWPELSMTTDYAGCITSFWVKSTDL